MRVNPGSAESLAWSWVHYFCCLHFTSANITGAVARKGQPSPPTAEYLVICKSQWDKTPQTTASGILPWAQQVTWATKPLARAMIVLRFNKNHLHSACYRKDFGGSRE